MTVGFGRDSGRCDGGCVCDIVDGDMVGFDFFYNKIHFQAVI